MKNRILIFTLFILCISCKRREQLDFDRFSVVGYSWSYNKNYTTLTFRTRQYFELNANGDSYIFQDYNNKIPKPFKAHISEDFVKLINNTFSQIHYDTIPCQLDKARIYDGWSYCYCIKNKGEKERFYYYNPYALPDDWKPIFHKVISIINTDTIEPVVLIPKLADRFDEVRKRIHCVDADFPPPPIKASIKFIPPPIKQDD